MINKLEDITIENKYFKFKEEKPTLSNSLAYYIDERYEFFYSIKNKSANPLSIKLETKFSSEITIQEIKLKAQTTGQFSIILNPISEGKKSFKIFAEFLRIKQEILSKQFNVELKRIAIEAKIDKPLPTSMKLGQKSETIFLFTNTGNQTVTDVSIDIKQIESTE